jgi:pimeloyl-ACP methyl ester carboxylesterase
MESKFIEIDGVNMHYRKKGIGPAMILLHPSPRNSSMLEPLMHLLADSFTVVAPDIPGYGYSSPLPARPASLYDYVPYLHAFIGQLFGGTVCLYGTATGAQLAIAYGLMNGAKIQNLYLDNAAHFEEEECSVILHNYFPDFTPQQDGSHLQQLWQHVCEGCLYFPWYDQREEKRIATQLPAAGVIQRIVNDYLLAGEDYADAYRAAFKHERAAKVQALQCRTTIFKWMGSPLLKHIEALLLHSLPANINTVVTPAENNERYAAMKQEMILSLNKQKA